MLIKNLRHRLRLKTITTSPKSVRATTLFSGSISQFCILYLINKNFGDSGIILLGALSVLGSVGSLFEFGRFSLIVSISNNGSYSDQEKREFVGTFFALVFRNNIFFVLIAAPLLPHLITTINLWDSIVFVFLSAMINCLTFITKYLLAIGLQSQFFAWFSTLHVIIPLLVLTLTEMKLTLVSVLQIYYLFTALVISFIAVKICRRYRIMPLFVKKISVSDNTFAIYFFIIGLELGVFYIWDRIWISQFMSSIESANYALLFIIFSSFSSILSLDFQNFWNKSFSESQIDFFRQLRRMRNQGLFFLVVFNFTVYLAFRLLDREILITNPAVVLLSIALCFQSMHNLTSGMTSKSIAGLKFHFNLLLACIFIRIFVIFSDLLNGSLTLNEALLSWILPFIFLQFPATLVYALKVNGDD